MNLPQSLFLSAREKFSANDLAGAEELARKCIAQAGATNFFSKRSRLLLGWIDWKKARYSQALGKVKGLEKDDLPLIRAKVHFFRASVWQSQNLEEKALSEAKLALQLHPDLDGAWRLVAIIQARRQSMNRAMRAMQKALALCPQNASYWSLQSEFAMGVQDYQQAFSCAEKALKLDSDNAVIWNSYGMLLTCVGQDAKAASAFRKALALEPNHFMALANLGSLTVNSGDWISAANYLEAAVQLQPNSFALLQAQASLYVKTGEYKKAEQILRRLKRSDPENSGVLLSLLSAIGQDVARQKELPFLVRKISQNIQADTQSAFGADPPMVTLIPVGRAGSMFLHSLFDGHPQISTVPGVYLKGFFGQKIWSRFCPPFFREDWRSVFVKEIIREYAPLFDARNRKNVIGAPFAQAAWLAKASGFMDMGPDRDQFFLADQNLFVRAMRDRLMPLENINQKEAFLLFHKAWDEMAIRHTGQQKKRDPILLYHLHNPDGQEFMCTVKTFPDCRHLFLVRDPLLALESWMMIDSQSLGRASGQEQTDRQNLYLLWTKLAAKLASFISLIRPPLIRGQKSAGVRLEDIKHEPEQSLEILARWMGIDMDPSLLRSEFMGLQYWGPASKTTKPITGFDPASINRKAGSLFGERDMELLRVLLTPFCTLYGYEYPAGDLKVHLHRVRPLLNQPLEFETRFLAENGYEGIDLNELAPSRHIRTLLTSCWEMLHGLGTYPGMVPPLEDKFTSEGR